jgi:hypothetical protein
LLLVRCRAGQDFTLKVFAAADLSRDRLRAATAHAHKLLALLIGANPTLSYGAAR